MSKKIFTSILTFIAVVGLSFCVSSCGAPKEGCGMDPSIDYNKVDYTKKPKKRSETSLFSKDHQKRMKKRK